MRYAFGRIITIWLASSIGFLFGCSKTLPSPAIVAAKGIVKIDGEPAEGVMVQFLPEIESGKNCPTSSGVTDEEGRFTLKIADGRDGAVVGKCRVTLAEAYSAPRYGNEDDSVKLSKPRKTVPASYAIPKPSGLSAEVKRDGGPIEIDIKAN